jgi:chromosome partitioning protein
MAAVTVAMINMKGGVGKTTLAFNLAWYCAWKANKKVLAVDLDPQANLSQYFMGARGYLDFLEENKPTVVDIFEQFSAPNKKAGSPTKFKSASAVHSLQEWDDDSLIHIVPSRLELAWTLKNPTEKAHLLPRFLSELSDSYDLILIDCAPTESILTTAAYMSSRHVVVPVKPEFLAAIGLPLLARSLEDFASMHQNQKIQMSGIIFNDLRRTGRGLEQRNAMRDVNKLAKEFSWDVFDNRAHHSDSYPTGSRDGTPIFMTRYARDYVSGEFHEVADEFLGAIGLQKNDTTVE